MPKKRAISIKGNLFIEGLVITKKYGQIYFFLSFFEGVTAVRVMIEDTFAVLGTSSFFFFVEVVTDVTEEEDTVVVLDTVSFFFVFEAVTDVMEDEVVVLDTVPFFEAVMDEFEDAVVVLDTVPFFFVFEPVTDVIEMSVVVLFDTFSLLFLNCIELFGFLGL